jgi:hypothetical protein
MNVLILHASKFVNNFSDTAGVSIFTAKLVDIIKVIKIINQRSHRMAIMLLIHSHLSICREEKKIPNVMI